MTTSFPFFKKAAAAAVIQAILEPASFIRIATAYFRPSGYQVLQDVLAGKTMRLLIGRTEGGQDRLQAMLDDFIDRFLESPLERRTSAMRQMLNALEQGKLLIALGDPPPDGRLSTYLDARYLDHHAKLYIADEKAVIVTSANFSYQGLKTSIEAGISLTDPDDVAYFVQQFDACFDLAKSITDDLIERLRQLLGIYPPYFVYARALLTLYDLPEQAVTTQLPPLSDYQKPVVSRTLEALEVYGGAMMIASTGLGKTVMAAHIAAYLKMRDQIDRVLVICPAGLRENWRRHMAMTRISSVEFSYATFSMTDRKSPTLRQLEYELGITDEKTLVLIDESHHLRNPGYAADRQKERYTRVQKAVHERGALALLLTATPFSREIADINAQLGVLPKAQQESPYMLMPMRTNWRVANASDLSSLPVCPMLTTPTVVNEFSETDADGHKFVRFIKGGSRYFPHQINLRTVVFDTPTDPILIDLINSPLLLPLPSQDVVEPEHVQTLLPDIEPARLPKHGIGLYKAQAVHQFCSSLAQIHDFTKRVSMPGEYGKTVFIHQSDLTAFVKQHSHSLERYKRDDPKFKQLLAIVQATKQKVVIFCYYRHTAKDLTERLKSAEISAETTEGCTPDKVETLLRRFAPLANEVLTEEYPDDLQVLVVTSALAEGYNLQDAAILVNYDLPWTVLMLAQRMGRVLRPWHEPRAITIYNFIPQTMFNPDIQIAMNWHERLQKRSAQHQQLADIPVLTKHESDHTDGFEMAELARQLKTDGDIALDLDDVLGFIQKAEQFSTSGFFNDLFQVKANGSEAIMALPNGFKSIRRVTHPPQLFLLVRYRRRPFAILFDATERLFTTLKNVMRSWSASAANPKHRLLRGSVMMISICGSTAHVKRGALNANSTKTRYKSFVR